jgi:hypothetical protein
VCLKRISLNLGFIGISSPGLKADEVIFIKLPPSTLFVGTISNTTIRDKKTYSSNLLKIQQVMQSPLSFRNFRLLPSHRITPNLPNLESAAKLPKSGDFKVVSLPLTFSLSLIL